MKRISRGFTLAELLIVVAIIAVLVAIAIPIFNKQLEKSREAHDIYTMRQAASLAVDIYYEGIDEAVRAGELRWWATDQESERTNAAGVYDPGAGTFSGIESKDPKIPAYGKGTKIDTKAKYSYNGEDQIYVPGEDYRKAVVMVAFYPYAYSPHIDVYWKNKGSSYVGGINQNQDDRPKYSIRIPIK